MKAYRIIIGMEYVGFYEDKKVEKAEYFFNKEKALARYAEGEYEAEDCEIITYYGNGKKSVGHMHPMYFERELKNAKPNVEVKLVKIKYNRFRMEEIEIEE